jgi:hypothetical protein
MSKHYQDIEKQLIEQFGLQQVNLWLSQLENTHGENGIASYKSGDFKLLKEVIGDIKPSKSIELLLS